MHINTIFFDVGETLVDETRQWGGWADWLAIPRLTFFGALGGVIAAATLATYANPIGVENCWRE